MIPAPVAPVASPVARRAFKSWWFGYLGGTSLLLAAVIGGFTWSFAASPIRLARWQMTEGGRMSTLAFNDTWFVYAEYPGAATDDLPPPLLVTVRERAGTDVHVTVLGAPGTDDPVPAYRDPWHEGRAIARFSVTRPGPYDIRVTPLPAGSFDAAEYSPSRTSVSIAVGRRISSTWFNSFLALVPLVVVPAGAGASMMITTRRRREAARVAAAHPPAIGAELAAVGR